MRLFAYGALSVMLVLYLAQAGLSSEKIGKLLTLTLVGDTFVALWITVVADRIGRRRMLDFGAASMMLAGVVFAVTQDFALLLVAAIVAIISPSGCGVGPFLSIEQASLAQIVAVERRTSVFARYNLVG